MDTFCVAAMEIHRKKPKTAGGSSFSKWLKRIWRYAHRCLGGEKNVHFLMELLKSLWVLCEKWIMENRRKSCLS